MEISREQPSLQLVGHPDHVTLDLATLQARGVRVVGRLVDARGGVARFADDLVATTAAADIKLPSLLHRIDTFVAGQGSTAGAAESFEPHCSSFVDAETTIDLTRAGIRTVLWATGFRRQYPWLQGARPRWARRDSPQGGVTPVPGLYVIGLHFLRRRNSSFIDGVGADATGVERTPGCNVRRRSRHVRLGAAS